MVHKGPLDSLRGQSSHQALGAVLACVFLVLVLAPIFGATGIKVVCDDNYPPYAFVGADGTLEGIVPDHWKAWE